MKRSVNPPSSAPRMKARGRANQGLSPSSVVTTAQYAPTVSHAPWAKLMIFRTPKMASNPAATMNRIAAVLMMSRRSVIASFR